jgi:hypothetical protein
MRDINFILDKLILFIDPCDVDTIFILYVHVYIVFCVLVISKPYAKWINTKYDMLQRSFGWNAPCHKRCGEIKLLHCSKPSLAKGFRSTLLSTRLFLKGGVNRKPLASEDVNLDLKLKFCSQSLEMVTSLYEWKILWWKVKQYVINHNIYPCSDDCLLL